jgi:hypothetical protein
MPYSSKPCGRATSEMALWLFQGVKSWNHGHMARGDHELSKVLPGPAMPYPYEACWWAISETPFDCFRGRPPTACCQLLPL